MVITQTIQFERWCLECGTTCGGQCHVVILKPESEFRPERVWQAVEGSKGHKGHENHFAEQIAQRLASHLKPQGVGVVVETRHSQMRKKLYRSNPLPVVTMSLWGRMRMETELRKEWFRHMRGLGATRY